MKKTIALLIIFTMVFPLWALDLIIMKNGDTYLGSILSMDIHDKLVMTLQDGTRVEVKFNEINSIKKIEGGPANTAPAPNIIIQNTNTNTNENIVNVSAAPQEKIGPMVYVPRISGVSQYSPPRVTFRGVSYNVDDNSKTDSVNLLDADFSGFTAAVKVAQPSLDPEIQRLVKEIELKIPLKRGAQKNFRGFLVGGLLIGIAGFGIVGYQASLPQSDDTFEKSAPGLVLMMAGAATTAMTLIAGLTSPSINWDGQELMKNMVDRYNILYMD